MNDLYRMIDELHAIVTSPEFFKVRYPKAVEIKPGLFVDYEYSETSVTVTVGNMTEMDMYLGLQ